MSSTTTPRIGFVKPTPGTGENVNLATQLNSSWDKLDSAVGAEPTTEATKDSVFKFDGKTVRTTDSRLVYVWNATQSAWEQVVLTGPNSISMGSINTSRAASTDAAFTATTNADTQKRLLVQADGKLLWGSGSASGDTNLYRSAANKLKTDDDLEVVGSLSAGGSQLYRATVTLASASANITISSIPSNLKWLDMRWTARSTDPGFQAQTMWMRINGVSTSSTYRTTNAQDANGVSSVGNFVGAGVPGGAAGHLGLISTGGSAAGVFANGDVRFAAWNGPHAGYLGWSYSTYLSPNDTASTIWRTGGSGTFTGAGPYTSITLFPVAGNFDVGTQVTLMGWS